MEQSEQTPQIEVGRAFAYTAAIEALLNQREDLARQIRGNDAQIATAAVVFDNAKATLEYYRNEATRLSIESAQIDNALEILGDNAARLNCDNQEQP